MREIVFRGKIPETGQWVEGAFSPKDSPHPFAPQVDCPSIIKLEPPGDGFWFSVIPDTVGQYIGLKDIHGRKIFEGDIVRHHNGHPDALEEIGAVFWDERTCGWRRTSNGAFYRGVIDTYRMSPECAYEVLGNIYDNPELLGGDENG